MHTSPQSLHIVCEIPVDAALKIGATTAGRFAHLLSTPDVNTLVDLDLMEAAKPFITVDPDNHTMALEVQAARGTLVAFMDNHVVPALFDLVREAKDALAEDERNARSIAAFLEETDSLAIGTEPRYLERWRAGVLPQVELAAVIREALFGGSSILERAPRFRALQVEEFRSGRRPQVCPSATGHREVFEVVHDVKLDPAEFEIYQAIVKAAQHVTENAMEAVGLENVSMAVSRREHVMRCAHSHIPCNAVMRRKSVMLTFTWAGITVGRELALEPAK